jgi:16S rRNA (cytidine1402-2'-O)-methyltransferase
LNQECIQQKHPGHTLKIVATPIGTLQDLSLRAQEALKTADVVFCEDTRSTAKLLNMFEIKAHLQSLHLHNEKSETEALLEKYFGPGKAPCTALLVSDAGTPAVSDPGAIFIDACHKRKIRIENVPGPSSLACALASNGFLQPRTLFVGFLPRTKKDLQLEFQKWQNIAPVVVVGFESPNRLLETIGNYGEMTASLSDHQVCVHREISKKYEEHIRGSALDVAHVLQNKKEQGLKSFGECVLSFNIPPHVESRSPEEILAAAFAELQEASGKSNKTTKELCKEIGSKYNLSAKELFNSYAKEKGKE